MAKGDMTLRAVMKLAANDFTRGLGAVQKQIQGVAQFMKTAFAVGSVTTFGREMIKWTREFEDAMARAQAVSNASAEGFKFMRDEALRLGATTRYTSVQVAQTLEVLTRNGLSATNATRVLADTLKLAQANAVELADAGNMITNTLNMFGLSVDKAAYVTDILSATASHSATDLTSLYEAMTNAAPMAHALGMNIEEVAAALGALANVGVKGPDAGTQLRQFLQRLTDPLAMKKMKKLTGFAFDEDFINTQGLEGVLKKLQSLGLSVTQLNEIFTVRSSKSIIQLMNSMENFNSLLRTMGEASGTASRMFIEGVGSVRYELDILRSMWQNLMIDIGNSTEGIFLRMVRGAQNTITTIKQFGKSLSTLFKTPNYKEGDKLSDRFKDALLVASQLLVVYGIFHKKINSFYTSMIAGVKAWRNESVISSQIAFKEHLKGVYEQLIANGTLSASEKKLAQQRIAGIKASINGLKAQQRAAQALKATLTTIGWTLVIIAVETLITKLVAMNAEIRQANESVKESEKAAQNLESKVSMLINMIGDGSDKDSLNGAVNEAKRTFSEFADAINSAYVEAGKTGNYTKLKMLLQDIASLQNKIASSKAYQELVDATRGKFAKDIRNRKDNATSAIEKGLKNQGFNSKQIDAVYNHIADIIVRNNSNLTAAVTELKNYLSNMNIEVSVGDIENLVNWTTLKKKATSYGTVEDSPYAQAVNAYNKQKGLTKDITKEENQVKWQNAIDEFYRASTDAVTTYKVGTQEYNEAMQSAFQNLQSAVGGIMNQLDTSIQNEFAKLKEKWGKGNSGSGGGGEGGSKSKKKTTQDEFNDAVKEYVDELKKLNEQLKNGTITQEHYDKAVSDAKLNAVDKLSGFENIDKLLGNLPESFKETGNELVGMFKDYGKLMAENLILGFREKAAELTNQYENGPKDEQATREYNDSMDKLARDTMEELSKIKDLYKIYDKLDTKVRALWDYINNRKQGADAKDKRAQLDELDKNSKNDIKPPKFTTILGPDDKSVEGLKQNLQRELDKDHFFINIEMGNDEAFLDYLKEVIKNKESEITDLEEKLKNNDPSISLIRDETIKRVENLKKHLTQLMDTADTLEDKLDISKMIVKLDDDIKTLTKSTLDNISSLASAFDRLKDSVKDIAEAFGMEVDFEGLENGITVVNAIIQAIESLKQISEVFQAFHELMTKKQIAENGELALSNATVAASESTKALATTEAAIADGAEVAAASSAAMASEQQAAANYQAASSAGVKAAAEGAAAAAEGAESVANTPYIGPILAVAAAGAIAAALIAAFSKIKGFANGGFVGGSSYYGDKNLIRANTGELVLTRGDQRTLYRAIKTGNFNNGNGNVEFIIRGDQLVGVLSNHRRIHR